jgi:hypothetical protein
MDNLKIYRNVVSSRPALLPKWGLRRMVRLVRTLFRLSRLPAYRSEVFSQVPEIARKDPHHDSVMMGYDFHWTEAGPKLIEVNTNAGGWLLALLAQYGESVMDSSALPERVRGRLVGPFTEELKSWSGGRLARPSLMAILDEHPAEQFLFGEMAYCRRLLETEWHISLLIVDPAEVDAGPQGVFSNGRRIELVYNRHCDFYLESEAMRGLREACRNRSVCLTPHPFSYGLLGDKRRLALWSDGQKLRTLGMSETDCGLLAAMIPESRLLVDMDRNELWRERASWVFKPVTRFGSRGVLLGRKMSRGRFAALDPNDTLVQRMVPPSLTGIAGDEMKTDFRLYVYRRRILGVAARLYQGQVTNLRTIGGGFAPVRLI